MVEFNSEISMITIVFIKTVF